MTTRSRTTYKPMENQDTHAEDAPAERQGTTGGTLPELTSLMEMVRVMIVDRERREQEIAEERQHRNREDRDRREREREEERRSSDQHRGESERRIEDLHRQMERLQLMLNEHSVAAATARGRTTTEPIKLTKLTEGDDIESYLTTFERVMATNEVNGEHWSFHLAPNLTGKVKQAYSAIPPDDAKTYNTIKEAILRRYDINEETYRQRFRKLRPTEGEPPQEVITRLKDLATQWGRKSRTQDALLDLIVMEQFLAILPEDIRVAVIERQPKECGSG